MTNYEAALQIIQNSKGITESQLMANKAAYIANRIVVNRLWLIIFAAIMVSLIVLCIVSANSKSKLYEAHDGLVAAAFSGGLACLIVVVALAVSLNGWIADPSKRYADYILQMAKDCLC